MIEVRDLHKTFHGEKVLDGVSFQVRPGETFVILGRSGTGKTVTLKHLVGLLQPEQGHVRILGVDIVEERGRALQAVRQKIGYLFQGGALMNSLSVGENVALPLHEHERKSRAEIRRIVAERLSWVELDGIEGRMPSELSLGMKKRVSLARALVRDPQIILYDEPTSGLDPITSNTIDALILSLQQRLHVTSVVVTHDLHSAFHVGNTIALLDEGRIVAMAPPDAFRANPDPRVQAFIQAQ
ncbi:MAG: ATP-binding cassette domain-containing protein [Planctomycetota bacterium]